MTDLDLEAIKARAGSKLGDLEDFGVCYWNPREAGEEVLRLVEEVEQLRDRLTITNETIERAALAIAEVDEWPTNEELGGNLTGTRDDEFRNEHIDMARAALEAALKEDQDAVTSGEWAAFQLEELRDRVKITDDMIERAATEIFDRPFPNVPRSTEMRGIARAALEAALGGHE